MARNKKLRKQKAAGEPPAAVPLVPAAKVPDVIPPVVAPAVPVERPKKTRYVREPRQDKPESKAAPLPPRSTTMVGKLMTKQLKLPPKT